MEQIRTQVIALLFMLVFVLGVTVFERTDTIASFLKSDDSVAAVVNPVADFLGTSSLGDAQTSTAEVVSQPTQADRVTLWDRIRSMVNTPFFSTPQQQTPVRLSARTPLLLCIPNVIREQETTLVFWACRDGSNRTKASGFDTNGRIVGTTRISNATTRNMTLDCISDREDGTFTTTTASCAIQVIQPDITLSATPSTVVPGATTRITWQTKGIRSCTLRSSNDDTFAKTGVSGDIAYSTHVDTELTLTCEDVTGFSVSKKLPITVE